MPESRSTIVTGYVGHNIGSTLVLSRTYSATDSTYNRFVHYADETLAPLASDTSISFNDITTSAVIFVETDIDIDVKIGNTGNTATRISSMYLVATETTALYLSNPSSTETANVKITIIGT